jgi:hypothetical protein
VTKLKILSRERIFSLTKVLKYAPVDSGYNPAFK